ncbi:hypothetical protein BDQ12DRAFT_611118 [Crucibulum laeve]|uniref:Uncharacterized protein n=1 Tax=Crucibulum laeve TaxID=68775 RepID=A0A5C3LU50_9AGAR|nr:hypothetical protein BDQ12DRAFT_611118 [Crucibulum laeve]
MSTTNNNMEGKNQYKDCSPKDDGKVAEYLCEYHQCGIIDHKTISKLLQVDHDVIMETTVDHCHKALGLTGSGVTTKVTPDVTKQQLVLDAMAKDLTSRHGPRTIKETIVADTGILLTRYVAQNTS